MFWPRVLIAWSVSIYISVILLTDPQLPTNPQPDGEVAVLTIFSAAVIKFLYMKQLDAFIFHRQESDSWQAFWHITALLFILGTLLGMPIFSFTLSYFFHGEFDYKTLPIYFILFNLPVLVGLTIFSLIRKR